MSRRVFLTASILIVFSGLAAAGVNIANSPGTQSWSPRLAVDGQGTSTPSGRVAGSEWRHLYSGQPGRRVWSTPINLSNTSLCITNPQVCGIADPNNNVYVIYTDGRDVKLRINQGGTWGSAFVLDSIPSDRTDRCDAPRVEVAPSGDIFTIWFYANYREVFSRARINGVWENKQQLNSGRGSKITDIAIGTNIVAATWTEKHDYLDIYQVAHVYRSRTFNSTWSAITHVCPSEDNQQYPCLEVDSNDISHVVWTTEIGERVVKYVQGAGTSFTSPVDLSPLELLHYPSMTERNNNLYVCWQVGAYGGGQTVDFHNTIGGTWQGRGEVPSSSGTFPMSPFAEGTAAIPPGVEQRHLCPRYIIRSRHQPIITGTVRTPTGRA
jgi:hypothetical protein